MISRLINIFSLFYLFLYCNNIYSSNPNIFEKDSSFYECRGMSKKIYNHIIENEIYDNELDKMLIYGKKNFRSFTVLVRFLVDNKFVYEEYFYELDNDMNIIKDVRVHSISNWQGFLYRNNMKWNDKDIHNYLDKLFNNTELDKTIEYGIRLDSCVNKSFPYNNLCGYLVMFDKSGKRISEAYSLDLDLFFYTSKRGVNKKTKYLNYIGYSFYLSIIRYNIYINTFDHKTR